MVDIIGKSPLVGNCTPITGDRIVHVSTKGCPWPLPDGGPFERQRSYNHIEWSARIGGVGTLAA
jgi:hypothetical protein